MKNWSFKDHQLVSYLASMSATKRNIVVVISLICAMLIWYLMAPISFGNAWLSKDQQAAVYFNNGQYKQAAALFQSPEWKAYSTYSSGDFAGAIELLNDIKHTEKDLAIANAYAHSGKFEKAKSLYQALYSNDLLSEAAKENYRLMVLAIEKVNSAPPEKSSEKTIDDRQIASEETDKESDKPVTLSNQAWLNQVRQDPSNFLRQKFQSEYANEQN